MTKENYKDLIQSSSKLIVDVWAEWCGPCKRTTPVFEKMAEQYQNIVFAKLNADNERNVAMEFNITSLPSFLIFKGGSLTNKWAGADVGRLRKEIEQLAKN